jgi:hypothetical protein
LSLLLLASLAVLSTAVYGSLALTLRSGETRVLLLTGVLGLLGIRQCAALWQGWGAPLRLDAATGSAAAGLAASVLGLLAVIAVARILRELDRAETLHWEGMEGVRGLTELAARRELEIEEKLPRLLGMGCERLGLEIGIVSRVRGERYEVLAIHAPEGFPVSRGAAFALGETYCRSTLASDRPVAVSRVADAHWTDHPARSAFRFGAYLASAVRIGKEPFGTLVFASLEPRKERFTATHKDLLALMAQWLGAELERKALLKARNPTGSRSGSPPRSVPPRRHEPARTPGLRLNALLERLEKRILRSVGAGVEIALEPAPDLQPARDLHIPLDAIVLSLVRKAAEAMPEGGRLTLATANQELAGGDPQVLPAVAPDRYVTLSVSETGGALDADALTRVFDGDEPTAEGASRKPDGRLPLSTLYRMLQRAGGDLSVEVEPGRGSTFTIFLPLAEEKASSAQAPAPSLAPAAPAAGH